MGVQATYSAYSGSSALFSACSASKRSVACSMMLTIPQKPSVAKAQRAKARPSQLLGLKTPRKAALPEEVAVAAAAAAAAAEDVDKRPSARACGSLECAKKGIRRWIALPRGIKGMPIAGTPAMKLPK